MAIASCLVTLSGCHEFSLSSLVPKWPAKKPPVRDSQANSNHWSPEATPQQKAEVQMAMARTMESQGQTEQAIAVYQGILAKSKRADAYHRLALLHDKKGDPLAAEKYYQEALKHDAKNAEIHCDYGYSRYVRRDFPAAEKSLRKAIALKPTFSRAHNNLGLLLARTGRDDEALKEFAKSGCSEAVARCNLAFALATERRWQEAESQFQQALTVDPSSKAAQEGLAAVHAAQANRPAFDAMPGTGTSQPTHLTSQRSMIRQ
jgi:Tfp pilus assembly protein PilF